MDATRLGSDTTGGPTSLKAAGPVPGSLAKGGSGIAMASSQD